MALVTVIMTVYNKPRWLRQAMDSVLAQTFDDYELLVMEDNSPDPLVHEILADYQTHPKVTIVNSNVSEEDRYKTARYATLINEAVREHSTGKFITYICDDDLFYAPRLEVMVDRLRSKPKVSVVYCSMHNIDADGNVHPDIRRAEHILDNAWDKVDHNAVMHTRRAFDVVQGWHDHYGAWGGADAFFWKRLTEAGYLFFPIDRVLSAHRYHTDSVQWKIANNVFEWDLEGEKDGD